MSAEKPTEAKGTCFVVMGFGKKPDFETNRTLDLDKTYRNIIKPVAEEIGLKCIRADELVHSGLIDLAMYEQLLSADVVIADLSTSNSNAFYELGVRHALRPYTTIIICEEGLMKEGRDKLPFDINHIAVRKYSHMGEGIDYEEVMRFSKVLKEDIRQILKRQPPASDSPVYAFLRGLNPPARIAEEIGREMDEALGAAQTDEQPDDTQPHSVLMQQAEDAQKEGDFERAKALLGAVRVMRPDDAYVIHRLVLATYRSCSPTNRQALEEARELLKTLHPESSNDTWTLGLWGSVHEKLWNETRDKAYLDEALRAYKRGFNLRRDYYNGIHEAFIRNVRAANSTNPAEAIADFILAQRIRREVIPICEEWLASAKPPGGKGQQAKRALNEYLKEKSYVLAKLAEAYLGTGDEVKAQQLFDDSEAVIQQLIKNQYPAFKIKKIREGVKRKRAELQALLADSPLKYIKTDA
jgi:hypothetical protein